MRIGIDARELAGRVTGVGRYLAGLLREWSTDERARRHEFVLYAPEAIAMPLDARRFATRAVDGAGGTWWEQIQLPAVIARDHLDVWFAPAYSAPLNIDVPTVAAIHDLSFVAHPEWYAMKEGARRRLVVGRTAAQARAIVTISEFSRGEIIERLAVPPDKVHVIPPGITHPAPGHSTPQHPAPWQPAPKHPSPITHHSSPAPRVLYAGSIFNRRHVPDLIRAFAGVVRDYPDARLDIVGDNRSFPYEDIEAAIMNASLEANAHWHRYASDRELGELFAQARAFAFLSEYEGLGLTPLEALAAGIPPVLLDTPVARESCGHAALYVPPGDLAAVTRALEVALFSESARDGILEAAAGTLAKYDWPKAARATLALLEA